LGREVIGPYQVAVTGPEEIERPVILGDDMRWRQDNTSPVDTLFFVVNVDTGNIIHMAYGNSWAGHSSDRKEAARMAAVWNRCWMEEQAEAKA
jgi:hypothetical protein